MSADASMLQEWLTFALRIARQGGDRAHAAQRTFADADADSQIQTKSSIRDVVTELDQQVEAELTREIRRCFPEHGIYGEETGRHQADREYCWVIDPIDGTASYIHQQPTYTLSLALQWRGQSIIGVVYAPVLGEMYQACQGGGAFCNDRRIRVTRHARLEEAMVSTGFSCLRAGWKSNHNLPYFNAIAPLARSVRRFGSAALDLCYVASGREDAFWELNLEPYDYAAGILLVREAGGLCTALHGGGQIATQGLLATNGALHQRMLTFFEGYQRPANA